MFNNLKKRINESADQLKQVVENSPNRLGSAESKSPVASPVPNRKIQRSQNISDNELKRVKDEFKKLKEENERLKVKSTASDDLNRQFDEEIQNLKEEIEIRNERIRHRDTSFEGLENELKVANVLTKNLKKKLEISENIIESLKNTPELTSLPGTSEQLDPLEVQNLKEQLENRQAQLLTLQAECKKSQQTIVQSHEKISTLETSNHSLKTQLQDKTRELNFLGVQLNQLEESKVEESKKSINQTKKIEMLQTQLTQLSDLETKNNLKERESKQLEIQYQAKVRECEEYTLAMKRLKETSEALKKNNDEKIQDLKNEVDQLKFTVESNQSKWKKNSEINEDLKNEVETLREQTKNVVQTQKQKDTALQTTKMLLSDLEKKYNTDLADYEELRMKHDQLNSKFTTALSQANIALKESKEYQSELKRVTEGAKVHQKTLDSLRKELGKELKKSHDLSKELENVQKQVKITASPPVEKLNSPRGSFSKSPASRNASRDSFTGLYGKTRRPSGALYKSTSSMDDSVILGYDTDTREANWQYLKHIVLKFILATGSQRSSLAKVLCTVLHLTDREEQLLYETLAYKSSYLKTKKPNMFI